jgi:hypothetical protein
MKTPKLLLVMPFVFLCGFAVYLQNREKRRAIEDNKPFKLVLIEPKIRTELVRNKVRTEVRAYIGYEGRRPDWWLKGSLNFEPDGCAFLSDGKVYPALFSEVYESVSLKNKTYYLTGIFKSREKVTKLNSSSLVAYMYREETTTRGSVRTKFRLQTSIATNTQPFSDDGRTWAMNQ